jgi:hypothetical protein
MRTNRNTQHHHVSTGRVRLAWARQAARAAAAAITLLSVLLLPGAVAAEPTATLRTFVGQWYGHTRSLTVDSKGVAREFLGSGCCDPLVRLRLHLYAPGGTASNATVKAYVSWVHILDARAFGPSFPRPHTGQVVTWRLHNGVLTEPATHIVYCDYAADDKGRCGA